MAILARADRRWRFDPTDAVDAHGPGAVRPQRRHRRHARQGGAHHRPPAGRAPGQHGADPGRHLGNGRGVMKIAVGVGFVDQDAVDFVTEAERLGADSVWAPEAWGYDALTPLAFLAARTSRIRLATGIAQIGARTPAMLAMSAMSMQALSGGRFLLGLGTSGPQVMEGWHGVAFDAPVQATRETIDIVRMAARGERVSYDGRVYQLPRPGGAGKAIRSMAPPVEIPMYLASLGPR